MICRQRRGVPISGCPFVRGTLLLILFRGERCNPMPVKGIPFLLHPLGWMCCLRSLLLGGMLWYTTGSQRMCRWASRFLGGRMWRRLRTALGFDCEKFRDERQSFSPIYRLNGAQGCRRTLVAERLFRLFHDELRNEREIDLPLTRRRRKERRQHPRQINAPSYLCPAVARTVLGLSLGAPASPRAWS